MKIWKAYLSKGMQVQVVAGDNIRLDFNRHVQSLNYEEKINITK